MPPVEPTVSSPAEFLPRPVQARQGAPAEQTGSWKTLATRDRRALFERALDSLWLVFQPIVWLSRPDGPPFAFEALARNAEAQVSDPRELLSLAGSVGQIGELGRVVHNRASGTLRRNKNMTLFVNVDVDELLGPLVEGGDDLAEFAHRVVLEVTERTPISDLPEVRKRSGVLRGQGYRFAIDDLGGGYAGLASLVLLDPQFVKVDKALIRDVDTKPINRNIVGSLVALTRQLGIKCIVEGVETEGERNTLEALHCDLMQGYLFGRPGAL